MTLFITYIIAGFVQSAWIALPAGIIMMLAICDIHEIFTEKQTAVFFYRRKKQNRENEEWLS